MLITLAIIGVVAALTIPTVITNYRNHETEVKLKKVYTELSQAINRSIADNGPMDKWDFTGTDDIKILPNFINTYLTPYLKIQKNCYSNYNAKNCPSHKVQSTGGTANFLASKNYSNRYLVLNDGVMIHFAGGGNYEYFFIFVDINGEKGPNKMGVDVFHFSTGTDNYATKRLRFEGETRTNEYLVGKKSSGDYGCSKQHNGGMCGALIQRNGWKIPTKEEYVNKFGGSAEDYPW